MELIEIKKQLKTLGEQTLNQSLTSESSMMNAYTLTWTDNGILFIPTLPLQLEFNDPLYFKIFMILSFVFHPYFTLVRPANMQIVATDSTNPATSTALFYPVKHGVPERIIGTHRDVSEVVKKTRNRMYVPLMHDLGYDADQVPHTAISGLTGSGKSVFLTYLLERYARIGGDIYIFDGKSADPSHWALNKIRQGHTNIHLITPDPDTTAIDYLNKVTATLADLESERLRRQHLLLESSEDSPSLKSYHDLNLKPVWIVIDEIGAIAPGIEPKLMKDFNALLFKAAILSRSAGYKLTIAAQEFRETNLPTSVRSQLGVRVLLGSISKQSMQFLFDASNDSVPIPLPGVGSGIVSIADGTVENSGIQPLLTPTIKTITGVNYHA